MLGFAEMNSKSKQRSKGEGSMNITNFKRFRINDTENFIDVESCLSHSSYGVMLTAYDFASEVIEIRRKERQTAMFVLKYNDLEIPEYWEDAEVIFSTRK